MHKKKITSPSIYRILWTGLDSDRLRDVRETARPQPNLCFRQLVQSSVFVIVSNQSNSTAEVSKNVKHLPSSKRGGLGGILPFLSCVSKRIHFFFPHCWLELFRWRYKPSRAEVASLLRFIYHTQRDARTHTPGRTPLKEWSAYRRGCYLHNIQLTQDTNVYAFSGFRTSDPSNQASSRPPGTALTCITCTFNLSVASVWEQIAVFLIRELQTCVIF